MGPASTRTTVCSACDRVSDVTEMPCREKEAKLKEAKAALATKQTSAKRLERAFQALHENAVQLVRMA